MIRSPSAFQLPELPSTNIIDSVLNNIPTTFSNTSLNRNLALSNSSDSSDLKLPNDLSLPNILDLPNNYLIF